MNIFKIKYAVAIMAISAAILSWPLTRDAIAQFPNQHPDGIPMPPLPPAQTTGGPVAIGQAMAQKDETGKVAIIQAPPVTVTPAPAADFSIGTWIADLLGSLVAIFGSVIATFLTKWVMAVARKAGIEASQAMSDKLDQIINNGLHNGAANLQHDLNGKLNVQVKNEVIAQAVTYAQSHGADTIKDVSGLDTNDPKVVEALQARAAKLLSNIGPDVVIPQIAAAVAAHATIDANHPPTAATPA
jgi:hypothetical protein